MTSLYDISAEYRHAAEKLSDLDLDAQTIVDTLEGMSGELEVKAQNVVYFARNLETTAAAIKDAESSMAYRRKALENRADSLRRYVLSCMQVASVEKIECPHFKVSIRKNPPTLEIFEPGLVPAEFMTKPVAPPPEPNKTAIKDALKAGQDVPGAKLTAGVRLEVK